MEDLKEKTADLVDHIEDIAETYYRLTIINVIQKVTNIAASALVMVIACGLALFIFSFSGIALGLWLGDLLDNRAGGFLLAAGIFLAVLLLILAIRKKIIYPIIRNIIVRKVYD